MKKSISGILVCMLLACNHGGQTTSVCKRKLTVFNGNWIKRINQGWGNLCPAFRFIMRNCGLQVRLETGPWLISKYKEIQEAIEDIQIYCTDRPEVASIPMIDPALDSLNISIGAKDIVRFKNSYNLLTNSCNSCHQVTKHAFNVIQTPAAPPFTNQAFQKP